MSPICIKVAVIRKVDDVIQSRHVLYVRGMAINDVLILEFLCDVINFYNYSTFNASYRAPHSLDPDAIMYYKHGDNVGSPELRDDDIAGIQYLYGNGKL